MEIWTHKSITISWVAFTNGKAGVAVDTCLAGDHHIVEDIKKSFDYETSYAWFPKGTFDSPPRVFIGVSRISMKTGQDMSFIVDLSDVTEEGFYWEVKTWGKTEFRRLGFSWIAFA